MYFVTKTIETSFCLLTDKFNEVKTFKIVFWRSSEAVVSVLP